MAKLYIDQEVFSNSPSNFLFKVHSRLQDYLVMRWNYFYQRYILNKLQDNKLKPFVPSYGVDKLIAGTSRSW